MPVLDAPFERLQLELVEHPLVQHDRGVRARVLEVVHRQVLERHDQPLALDAARLVSNELAREERVLAKGLEVASRGDEGDLVDHGRIENVLIRRTTLAADHDAVGIRRSPLEGGGQAHGRGQARLLVAEPHTGRTVRLPKRRDAQTLHAIVDPGLADATGDERGARRTRVDHRERVQQQWLEVKPGIFRKALHDDPATGAQCLLFRLSPGTTYPEHGHPSGEELYVLEGSITVDETLLEQGDYYRTPPGERHFNHSNIGATVLVIAPPRRV